MKNGYSMNYVTNTLTITREFNRRANNESTDEYRILRKMRRDCPKLRIVFYSPKRRRTSRLNYDKMVCYIGCQKNAPARLQEFNFVREASRSQSSPYNFVKEWFLREFPNYKEIPKFDQHGNIVSDRAAVDTKRNTVTEQKNNDAA